MVDENQAAGPSSPRVHYQSVYPAGSGTLRPIVPYTLALPHDQGAPLLIGLSVDESCPSLALCSDMQIPYVHGFVTALQNPLRLLEFASNSSAKGVHRDNFLVIQQYAAMLYISRIWGERCLNTPGAFDDANRAITLTTRPLQWASQALGQLSGEPCDLRVNVPVEVHRDLKKLAKHGYRLQNRWRAHEIQRAKEIPQSTATTPGTNDQRGVRPRAKPRKRTASGAPSRRATPARKQVARRRVPQANYDLLILERLLVLSRSHGDAPITSTTLLEMGDLPTGLSAASLKTYWRKQRRLLLDATPPLLNIVEEDKTQPVRLIGDVYGALQSRIEAMKPKTAAKPKRHK
jgi:hypothetical protein